MDHVSSTVRLPRVQEFEGKTSSTCGSSRRNRNSIALVVVVVTCLLGLLWIVFYNRMISVVGGQQNIASSEFQKQNTVCSVRTVMYMDGFQWTSSSLFQASSAHPCLTLLVTQWTIDTPIKLFLSCILVFLYGILTELTTTWIRWYFSYDYWNSSSSSNGSYYFHSAVITQPSLHILQATLSYTNMILVMTYSIELFVVLLAGMGIGHYYILVVNKVPTSVRSVPSNDTNTSITTSTESKPWIPCQDRNIPVDTANSIPCCEFLSSYRSNETNSYDDDKLDDESVPILSQVS